jgi:hypothetical protein
MASEGAGAVGPPLGEMDLDEFRRAGHRIVDWIADYRAHPECYPVLSRCRRGVRGGAIVGCGAGHPMQAATTSAGTW